MKHIETNPIKWGWKRGYTPDQIADGLMIPMRDVMRELHRLKAEMAKHNQLLREPPAKLGGDAQKWATWQKQKSGARAALAAIEREKKVQRGERAA